MLIKFPFSQELKLLFQLINKKDELRIVGGSVRDFLFNKNSTNSDLKNSKDLENSLSANSKHKFANNKTPDIDLACKYLPEKTMEILQKNKIRTIPTGLKHGTITAMVNGQSFEITTLRKDVENYGRQAKVEFVNDFLEDAKRRDFTINAMSIDANGNLFDYFNGFEDLKNKKVRFIGNAKERIQEDYLRILRFFRFSCYYGDKIDETTLKEIVKFKDNLKDLSSHRIRTELLKTLICNDKTQLLYILDLMNQNQILKEIIAAEKFDLSHLKNLLDLPNLNSENDSEFLTRFAALIYADKSQNSKITKLLEFSNKEQKYITDILALSEKIHITMEKPELLHALFNFDKNLIINSLKLNFVANHNSDLTKLSNLINFINEIDLPNFIINGNDLLTLDISGKQVGEILNKLKNLWIESNFKITKEELLQIAKSQN